MLAITIPSLLAVLVVMGVCYVITTIMSERRHRVMMQPETRDVEKGEGERYDLLNTSKTRKNTVVS